MANFIINFHGKFHQNLSFPVKSQAPTMVSSLFLASIFMIFFFSFSTVIILTAHTVTAINCGHHESLRTYSAYVREIRIDIEITATTTASVVTNWLQTILNHQHLQYIHNRDFHNRNHRNRNRNLVVGFGVQWTPGNLDPPADTLQLCIHGSCLIFHLSLAGTILDPRRYRSHGEDLSRELMNEIVWKWLGFEVDQSAQGIGLAWKKQLERKELL